MRATAAKRLRAGVITGVAGAITVSALGALAYLQARWTVAGALPAGARLDGHVGADVGPVDCRVVWLGQIGQRIDAIDRVLVVLVSIPHLNHAIRLPHPLRRFAAWRASWLDRVLRAAARKRAHVHYASVRRRPDWIRHRDLQNFLAADRFHPSGAGYAVWADRVTKVFDQALSPDPIRQNPGP